MPLFVVDDTFDFTMLAGSSCAFGVFDGLHIGHQYLIRCACDAALAEKSSSFILTFDRDPDEVFHPERLQKLMSNETRLNALQHMDASGVVVFPFTREFFTRSPEGFLNHAFPCDAPAHLHVGEDFRFGAKAAGTVDTLRKWGRHSNCQIHAHHLISEDGLPITSTRIRLLIQDGAVDEALRLLGHSNIDFSLGAGD